MAKTIKKPSAALVTFALLGNVRCYGELHEAPGTIKLTELQAEPLLRSGRISTDLSLVQAEEPETKETGSEGSVSEDAGANADQAKVQEFLAKVKAEGGDVPTVKAIKEATGIQFKGADRDAIWADLPEPDADNTETGDGGE
ncbi:hypothetical protein [Emcibacter sp.]|uniref:hypothetical protein n=1 Tax=Emcibacter sp. TaxID=1979954 RepID=UPI002AA78E0E|nr:hypothetical protein [Emcibacter sp.]